MRTKMKNDLDVLVHKFDEEIEEINIYPVGDVHLGSSEFSKKAFNRWKNMVMSDKNGKILIIGDVLDNGLKNSKTDSYVATLQPQQQRELLEKLFEDFMAERVIGAIQGNHENRTTQLVGSCPIYDVMKEFGLGDCYRHNVLFSKISLGKKRADRQYSYTVCLAHGAGRVKKEKFSLAIEGLDVLISGHTHQPSSEFRGKLVFDSKNDVMREVGCADIVVPSMLSFGGYGAKAMYTPTTNYLFPVINLSGKQKKVEVYWK